MIACEGKYGLLSQLKPFVSYWSTQARSRGSGASHLPTTSPAPTRNAVQEVHRRISQLFTLLLLHSFSTFTSYIPYKHIMILHYSNLHFGHSHMCWLHFRPNSMFPGPHYLLILSTISRASTTAPVAPLALRQSLFRRSRLTARADLRWS